MANIVKGAQAQKNKPTSHVNPEVNKPEEVVAETASTPPAGVNTSVDEAPAVLPAEVGDDTEASRLLASQVTMHSFDPHVAMQFPGNEAKDVDVPSSKDYMLNDHKIRLGNKRRFLTDALCRALGCEAYLLEVDKPWAPNPLGKGGNVSLRYTREMVGVYVLFDKFDVMPDPRIVALKKKYANENGYKYVYETPEVLLTHDVLNKLLKEQEEIVHPDQRVATAGK